jgi:O-antigen/teichoic acid export membrane protein
MRTESVTTTRHLTSGRLLARNTLWNLSASVASIIVALLSVPILIRYLGTDRFGVISLIWVIEGQFSLFDLGLSRALTKLVSEKLGASRHEDIPAIFWCTLLIMGAFGLLGSILLRVLAPWLVHSVLKVPANIQTETITSFYLVAFSLPVVISSAGLQGFLAAHQRFDLLSAVRVPISLFSYLAPLTVLAFSKSLGPVIFVLVMARCLSWLVHLVLCFRVSPELFHRISVRGAPLRRMFHFGGWMTVTNIVSPIMVNLDRFLIGALISMAAVAYYATPYEAVAKLWIIPSALAGVLFPAFSTALVQDRERAALLFEKGVKYTFLALFPIVLCALTLGHWALYLWLGPVFAEKSTTVLHLLALGVFTNSLALVPFWQIQAANRPDLAAKVHMVELPFYLLVFWALTSRYGIVGAGVAWLLRTSIDAAVMFYFSGNLLPETKAFNKRLFWALLGVTPLFVASMLIKTNVVGIPYLIAVCVLYLIVTWVWFLTPQERQLAQNPLRFFTKLEPETR